VNIYLSIYVIFVYELILYVYVWRWSCDLSHGSRWYSKWCWWCL